MYHPFSYQNDCLDAIEAVRNRGLKKALIVMASGLGKTVTMAFDAKRYRERQRGGRVLFLCHNNDILYQAKTTFQAINGLNHTYGYYHGEEKHLHHVDFLFASFQTMDFSRELFNPKEFSYVVVDESHHSQADTFRATIDYFTPQFLLGATATPDRLDLLDIRDIFGQEVYYLPLEEAMARGLVTPVDYRLLTDEIVKEAVLQIDKENKEKRVSLTELNRTIFIPRRDEEIAKIIARHTSEIADPRVIIFCTSIRHCEHLAQFIPDSFAIHSLVPERERAVKLEMFRQGLISTILTVNAFNEGIDIPQANVVVFLRSTTSNAVFLQQLGRGLRKSDGKDKVIALDFVANCERIKMTNNLWRSVEDTALKYAKESGAREATHPMTLDVHSIEFIETIVPLLKLMDRVRPTRISEVLEMAREYSSRNLLPADMFAAGTGKKLWWHCPTCSYEWQATGHSRMKGSLCPNCSGRVATENNNLAVTHPDLAKEYSDKNPLPANKVVAGTNKKLWWRCSTCAHEWQTIGANRTRYSNGCPACSGRVATPTKNLALAFPDLVTSWSSKNPVKPDQVTPYSNRKFWWTCETCSHEWEAIVGHRVRGTDCPVCARKVVTMDNCIVATHPDLAKEYSSRNPVPVNEVLAGSDKKYWWKCSTCSHEWEAVSYHRARGYCGCPSCKVAYHRQRKQRTLVRNSA